MMDGIPLYGPYGDNGVAPSNLDGCQGHTDSTYPFYHYHLKPNRAFPYTVTCLTGCIYNSNGNNNLNSYVTTNTTCVKSATQYDYSAFDWTMSTTTKSLAGVSTTTSSAAIANIDFEWASLSMVAFLSLLW